VPATSGLPDPADEPTITVARSAGLLGISRASAYAAANRGEIPVIRIGRRMVVPTARLLALLHGSD
jgi:Helix-turn-helix domain